jgi:YidC/Oxa1 family membrane protein insertase
VTTPTDAKEQFLALRNAQVSATFSTSRSLIHWRLDDYFLSPDKEQQVDLAGDRDSHLNLALLQEQAPVSFAVQGSSADAVTLAASHNNLAEQRVWRLDGYVAELTWTAQNLSNRPIVIHPSAMLQEALDYENISQYDVRGPIVAQGNEIERPGEKDAAAGENFRGVSWGGFDNKYFLKVLIPPAGLRDVGMTVNELGRKGEVADIGVRLALPGHTIEPGAQWSTKLRIYLGPKVPSHLSAVGAGLEESIDYGFFGFLARPLLALMKLFFSVVQNYGIAIILVTVLIKLLFYPLTRKSFTAMKDMQRMQPKLEALKKKYANDKDRLNREMMTLYRTEGINPLGGCLPILLQIPVFFALYQVLLNAIELRHAPFMLWVNDLSAPEDLFTLGLAGFDLPIRLLPLIMGITMVLQQKLTPSTMDKAQQQIMMIMPVMFTFLFWGFPSGLVLYWLVNNVISIAQQWWITRETKAAT